MRLSRTNDELAAELAACCCLDERTRSAFGAVDRARFLPPGHTGEPYANTVVPILLGGTGERISTVSAPSVVGTVTALLGARETDRVLEVGTGSGYQAALLGQLSRRVDTIDLFPELVASARENLRASGAENVHARVGDGMRGCAAQAPYDRVLFSVGATALPDWVWEQTSVGARVVIPLTFRGLSRVWAFDRAAPELFESVGSATAGFVPLIGQEAVRSAVLDERTGVEVLWGPGVQIDVAALRAAAGAGETVTESVHRLGAREDPNALYWRVAGLGQPLVRLTRGTAEAAAAGLRPVGHGTATLVNATSLAFLVGVDRSEDEVRLGVAACGPDASQLVAGYLGALEAWACGRSDYPTLRLLRGSEPTLSWPEPTASPLG